MRIDTALQLIESSTDQHCEVYLDLRLPRERVERGRRSAQAAHGLNDLSVVPKLVACVDQHRPNLAITSLKPLPARGRPA